MHPDEIHVEQLGIRHQLLRRMFVDAYLRYFPQENVAGMDIDYHIRSLQVAQEGIGHLFGHGSVRIAGEDAIHVQVEARDAPGDGVDAQRIQCGINLHGTVQFLQILLYDLIEPETDILAFQFVAVRTRHDADTFV